MAQIRLLSDPAPLSPPQITRYAALIFMPLAIIACSNEPRVEGGLYAVPDEGGYSVLKILKLDEEGVHLRTYSNVFAEIPVSIDEASLYMAGLDAKDGEPMGMAHLPISHQSFSAWHIQFLKQSQVTAIELEGYERWKASNGEYFQ